MPDGLDDNLQVGVAVMNSDDVVVGMVGGRGSSTEPRHPANASSGSSKPFTAYGPLLTFRGQVQHSFDLRYKSLCLSGYQLRDETMVVPYMNA